MNGNRYLEPNPAPGIRLTSSFFSGLAGFAEACAAYGRPYGLLPADSDPKQVLPRIEANCMKLTSILAIGVHGYPIEAGPDSVCTKILPLDLEDLPGGPHTVYACLSHDKVSIGDLVDTPEDSKAGTGSRIRRHRCRQVILAVGQDRMQHLDWLPVARIERVLDGGALRTLQDHRVHPPILSMKAYYRTPNPVMRFAEKMLQKLDHRSGKEDFSHLRSELITLQNIAESGHPEVVFVQAQRCIVFVRLLKDKILALDGSLETYRYCPDTFWKFLENLRAGVEADDPYRYPEMLEIEFDMDRTSVRKKCTKLNGILSEHEDKGFWSWSSDEGELFVNGFAIYFRHAIPHTLPVLKYSRHREDPSGFFIAKEAKDVSGPGVAMVLMELKDKIDTFHIATEAATMFQLLRNAIGDGHAIYYW